MNPFGTAINAIFANPHMSVAAEYRVSGADPAIPVRVIKVSPSVVNDWNRASFVQASHVFDLRVSEVAEPAVGDTITIDGVLYSVREEPLLDSQGLCWKLGMRDGA